MNITQDWLLVSLEEYKAVRAECLSALDTQNATLRFGLAIIGILIAAAINMLQQNRSSLWAGVILLCIPLISVFVTLIWAGEVMRLIRAHGFVKSIEKKINKSIDNTLRYECWVDEIEDKYLRPRWNYRAVVWLFYSISALAFVGGTILILINWVSGVWWLLIAMLIIACLLSMWRVIRKKLKELLDKISEFLKKMEQNNKEHLTP